MNPITKMANASQHSFHGIKAALKSEMAFRLEFMATCILIPVAVIYPFGPIETAMMISSLLLMLLAELVNTGIEALADRLTQDQDPYIKIAKDVGSACVLVSLINVAVVWGFILFG